MQRRRGSVLSISEIQAPEASHILSLFTLDFYNINYEEQYQEYSAWQLAYFKRIAILGILLSASVEIPIQIFAGSSHLLLFALLAVYAPLLFITAMLLYYSKKPNWLKRYFYLFSIIYTLLIGPVLITGRFLILHKTISGFPQNVNLLNIGVYVLILLTFIYSFSIRYVHTVLILIVACPVYVGAAIYGILELPSESSIRSELISGLAVMVFFSILIAVIAYDREYNRRMHFISKEHSTLVNRKLFDQLKGLQSSYENSVVDLDSPFEKAILYAKLLLASPSTTPRQIQLVQMILQCLSHSNVMAPDIYQQLRRGDIKVDIEQEKWIFNELAKKSRFALDSPSIISDRDLKLSIVEHTESSDFTIVSVDQAAKIGEADKTFEISYSPEIIEMLNKLPNYNFSIFDFDRMTRNSALTVLLHHLCVQSGLLENLHLPVDKFMRFANRIQDGYNNSLTFHTSLHAADVLHAVHYFSELPQAKGVFNDLDKLALYIGAAIHDFDHPGVNNNFLIVTADSRAILYNDISVLENHHCSAAFAQLLQPENNFLSDMDKKSFKFLRSMIVDIVLATDLAKHFLLLTTFKSKVINHGQFDPQSKHEDKIILSQMIMKAADVSNPTKEWSIYKEWITRVTDEFFEQGDKEKALGLVVSPYCNRDAPNASDPTSCQRGFIEFIVGPLFDALELWSPLGEVIDGLNSSRERFLPHEKKENRRKGRMALRPLNTALGPIPESTQSAFPFQRSRRGSLASRILLPPIFAKSSNEDEASKYMYDDPKS